MHTNRGHRPACYVITAHLMLWPHHRRFAQYNAGTADFLLWPLIFHANKLNQHDVHLKEKKEKKHTNIPTCPVQTFFRLRLAYWWFHICNRLRILDNLRDCLSGSKNAFPRLVLVVLQEFIDLKFLKLKRGTQI